jgi:hypothetical protein
LVIFVLESPASVFKIFSEQIAQRFGSTSATRGDFRHHAGRIADVNRRRSPVTGSMRLSLTRGIAPAVTRSVTQRVD